jgi:hypothetical protein
MRQLEVELTLVKHEFATYRAESGACPPSPSLLIFSVFLFVIIFYILFFNSGKLFAGVFFSLCDTVNEFILFLLLSHILQAALKKSIQEVRKDAMALLTEQSIDTPS